MWISARASELAQSIHAAILEILSAHPFLPRILCNGLRRQGKTLRTRDSRRLRRPFKVPSSKFRVLMLLRGEIRFVSKAAHQLFVRSVADDPVELVAVIIHHADVLHDDVVNPPFTADKVSFVVERKLLALLGKNFAVDVGVAAVESFPDVNDFLVGVRFDGIGVGALQKIAKKAHELILFLGGAPAPVGPEGAFRHLVEIKSRKQNLLELLAPLLGLGGGLES